MRGLCGLVIVLALVASASAQEHCSGPGCSVVQLGILSTPAVLHSAGRPYPAFRLAPIKKSAIIRSATVRHTAAALRPSGWLTRR